MARYETLDAALKNAHDCTELFFLHFENSHKTVKALPPEFGKLKKLEKLVMSGVGADFGFPDEMGELTSLKLLHLPSLPWKTLPAWLFRLGNLESFDLMSELTSLTDEITQLKKLRELRLWSQHWKGYPEVVCQLTQLTKLNIDGSYFRELPAAFGNLVELRTLELERIGLLALPPSIVKMKKLTKLSLSGNQLTELPSAIGDLTNLVDLDVSENRITQLPRSIGKLAHLESLKAQRNPMAALPDEIGELRSLKQLTLYSTPLTDLPPSLKKLGKLEQLDVSESPFTELPEVVCQISNLEELTIGGQRSHNEGVPPLGPMRALPAAIGELKKLRILDASYGYLESLPPEIGQLESLENLYLRKNALAELPPEIADLNKLKYLALEDNALESVPETLARCQGLRELNLTGNTFPKDEIAKLEKLNEQLAHCSLGMPREAKEKKQTAKVSDARLSAAVTKQLARLGAKLKSAAKIPAPKKVKIGDDEYLMPEALRQIGDDLKWPKKSYRGELNDFEMWKVEFGGLSSTPLAEYECVHHGGYALLATIDTGNMMLLVSLEDKKPEDPMTFWLDHDSFDLHEPSEFARLSKLLSKLAVEK